MSPFCIVVTVDIIMNVYLLLPLEGPLLEFDIDIVACLRREQFTNLRC